MSDRPKTPAEAALSVAVEWARGAIRRDAQNRYSLTEDWTLPAAHCSFWPDEVTGWESPLFRIEKAALRIVAVTVRAYQSTPDNNVCDGATLSPDNIPGILPAALFHDPWYCRIKGDGAKQFELLADALKVPRKAARKFGDGLFYAIARAGGCPWIVAQLYHFGIRVGYPAVRPFLPDAEVVA